MSCIVLLPVVASSSSAATRARIPPPPSRCPYGLLHLGAQSSRLQTFPKGCARGQSRQLLQTPIPVLDITEAGIMVGTLSEEEDPETEEEEEEEEDEEEGSRLLLFQRHRRTLLLQSSLAAAASAWWATSTGKSSSAAAAASGAGECDEEAEVRAVVTERVYMDVAIGGEEVGRMVIGLYGEEAKVGARRFVEMTVGRNGVSYRKKEFVKVMPEYVVNGGLRSFSLSGERRDRAEFTGGERPEEQLVPELEEQLRRRRRRKKCGNGGLSINNVVGAVSIVVREGGGPPPSQKKLVARGGKLELLEEAPPPGPNGTQFAICLRDAPLLDDTNLVVGRLLDGFDVLRAIANVKVVQQNRGSPYFQAAKLVGDTRAVVAERGFNRPYSKILITRCGRLVDRSDSPPPLNL